VLEYPPDVKADLKNVEATAENELGVDEDVGFDEENNLLNNYS